MQALGAPGKTEKALITRKVAETRSCISACTPSLALTTIFSVSPCTSISYMSFPRPTDVSRVKN